MELLKVSLDILNFEIFIYYCHCKIQVNNGLSLYSMKMAPLYRHELVHQQLVCEMSTSQHGTQFLPGQTHRTVESLHFELCLKANY